VVHVTQREYNVVANGQHYPLLTIHSHTLPNKPLAISVGESVEQRLNSFVSEHTIGFREKLEIKKMAYDWLDSNNRTSALQFLLVVASNPADLVRTALSFAEQLKQATFVLVSVDFMLCPGQEKRLATMLGAETRFVALHTTVGMRFGLELGVAVNEVMKILPHGCIVCTITPDMVASESSSQPGADVFVAYEKEQRRYGKGILALISTPTKFVLGPAPLPVVMFDSDAWHALGPLDQRCFFSFPRSCLTVSCSCSNRGAIRGFSAKAQQQGRLHHSTAGGLGRYFKLQEVWGGIANMPSSQVWAGADDCEGTGDVCGCGAQTATENSCAKPVLPNFMSIRNVRNRQTDIRTGASKHVAKTKQTFARHPSLVDLLMH
jgi:hypothetical protein